MGKAYRYPGVKPFTEKEAHLFFGRKGDISQLSRFIRTEDLVVLHGKSGLGKSSLINAGILPLVEQQKSNRYIPLQIRLRSYNPKVPQDLFEIFNQGLEREQNFIDDIPTKTTSVWHAMKSREYCDLGDKPPKYLLILDQFEELFTYPQKQYMEFGKELASLFNRRMPKEFRKLLRHEKIGNPDFEQKLKDEKLEDWIDQPVELKILIAIRTDKFNLLDKFSAFLPEVLVNAQLLEPFTKNQAKMAIQNPAKIEGKFDSPAFSFEKAAIDKVVDFLSSESNGQVEGFQLQIICRNIEENIIKFDEGKENKEARMSIKKLKAKKGSPQYSIENVEADFGDILRRYYDEQIATLESKEQKQARELIEDQLIADDRRVSLDQAIIQNFVSEELLVKLVDTRLIRREPNNLGGFSYEISHDTLLAPVMEARGERRKKEQQKERRQKALEAARKREEELEREKEEQEKELAQVRAEQAVKEKERAIKDKKTERRFKYMLGGILLVLGLYSVVLYLQNRTISNSEAQVVLQSKVLQEEFGVTADQLDSLQNFIQNLPEDQIDAATDKSRLQELKSSIEANLPEDTIQTRYKLYIKFNRLFVQSHIFPRNANKIPPQNVEFLRRIINVSNKYPKMGINIEVHTDDRGDANNNVKISAYRASHVADILIDSLHVDAVKISFTSKGESDPIVPIAPTMGSMERNEARKENRRVNLVFFPE